MTYKINSNDHHVATEAHDLFKILVKRISEDSDRLVHGLLTESMDSLDVVIGMIEDQLNNNNLNHFAAPSLMNFISFLNKHDTDPKRVFTLQDKSKGDSKHICTIKRGAGGIDFISRLLNALNEEYGIIHDLMFDVFFTSDNTLILTAGTREDKDTFRSFELGYSWLY